MALLQSSSASSYLWHMARLQQRIQRKSLPGQHVVLTSAAWGRPWLCWRAEGCSCCRPPFLRCNTQQLPHICLPWNRRFPDSHRNRITVCPLYAAETLLSLLWYDIREPIAQLVQHRLSSDLTTLNVRKFIHDLWHIKDAMMGKHIRDYPVFMKNGLLLLPLRFDAALLIGIPYGRLPWLWGFARVAWDLMSKNLKQAGDKAQLRERQL